MDDSVNGLLITAHVPFEMNIVKNEHTFSCMASTFHEASGLTREMLPAEERTVRLKAPCSASIYLPFFFIPSPTIANESQHKQIAIIVRQHRSTIVKRRSFAHVFHRL